MKITIEIPDTTCFIHLLGMYDIRSGAKTYSTTFDKILKPKDNMQIAYKGAGIGKGKFEISEGENDT